MGYSKQPVQYLLVGYPFAGKTTLAKVLESRLGFTRMSIDEVKFEFGYEGISDDDVPDQDWVKIFDELDKRIVRSLKRGETVINEYAWLTKDWRNRARKLASDLGFETKVIFVNTSEGVIRDRWHKNRQSKKRFDISDTVFNEAIRDFEIPGKDEKVIIYEDATDPDEWIKQNF